MIGVAALAHHPRILVLFWEVNARVSAWFRIGVKDDSI